MFEEYFRLYRTDDEFRTYLYSVLGSVCTVAIILYNTYLGISLKSMWNIFMAVYYVILISLRSLIINTRRKSGPGFDRIRKSIGFLMFLLNLSLILPVLMMIRGERTVKGHYVPVVVMALYMTVRIFFAIRSYLRSKRKNSILMRQLVTANLINVLVAALMLLNTLIMVDMGAVSGLYRDIFILFATMTWVLVMSLSYNSIRK